MSIEDSDAALRIVEAGRQRVLNRLRDAFAHQAATHADLGELDPAVLDRLVHEAADQAGTSVWRIALAEGAADEYGVGIAEALAHPAVAAAEQLVGPAEQPGVPSPAAEALTDSTAAPHAPSAPAYEPPAPPAETAGDDDVYDPWGLGDQDEEQAQEGATEPTRTDHEFEPDPEPAHEPEPAPGDEPEPAYEPPTAVHQPAPDPEPADEPDPEPEPEPEPIYEPGPALTADPEPAPEPAYEPPPEPAAEPAPEPAAAAVTTSDSGGDAPQALRIPAVHTSGIETLKQGDKDLELRLSEAGLDVLRQSTGVAIGRLDWAEITRVEVEEVKKGLRGRKVSQTLQVKTSRGQATFELPGLTEEESSQHLQPMLDRLRSTGMLAADES
jgi:hypothetical protein